MKVRTQDADKCLELLEKSVVAEPTVPAYFHLAWIYAKRGTTDKAEENIKAGLELDPENTNLLWLDKEMKKPEKKRSFKMPPSSRK
jgi:Tfp pilus assembly protein PilF